MLPPPKTRPTCTPARATSETSPARALTRSASSPNDKGPANASPLILRRMRLKRAMAVCVMLRGDGQRALLYSGGVTYIAHFVTDETGDSDGIADFAAGGFDEVGDGNGV